MNIASVEIVASGALGFISPLLVLILAAVSSLLFFKPSTQKTKRELSLSFVAVALALLAFMLFGSETVGTVFRGALDADLFSKAAIFIVLIVGLLHTLGARQVALKEGFESSTEFGALILFALSGALVVVSATELLTLFVGLELLSIPSYALCAGALGGTVGTKARGAESAIKYLLVGATASSILLLGIAVLFGITGTTSFEGVTDALQHVSGAGVGVGIGLVFVAVLIKLGAAPFHFWVADVYQGAPVSVMHFLAVVSKTAALLLLVRISSQLFAPFVALWSGGVWTVALLSVVVGNLLAIRQRSVKRMLAYSGVAQVGYVIVGILASLAPLGGGAAAMYYLTVYALTMVAILSVVASVVSIKSVEEEADELADFSGLAASSKSKAAVLALGLLGLAGVPPAFAGFLGKVFLFSAGISAGYLGLVILALLSSVVAAFYYLRLITAVYLVEGSSSTEAPDFWGDRPLKTAAIVATVIVVLIGFFPGDVLSLFTLAVEGL